MSFHRYVNIWVSVCLCITLAGCQFAWSPPPGTGAATREGAARQTVSCADPPDDGVGFLVRATYPWANGWIVLYRVSCPAGTAVGPGAQGVEGIGHTFVEQIDGKWYAAGSQWVGRRDRPTPEEVVEVGTNSGGGSDPRSQYSIVYGEALTPNVAAVQVTFAGGITEQARLSDGFFAAIVPGAVMACEARVLAADGTMLREVDLQPAQPCES